MINTDMVFMASLKQNLQLQSKKNKVFNSNFIKIFTTIFIITIFLSTSGCLESKKVIKINATIAENEFIEITDVDASSVSIEALRYPKDIPPNFPGVYVLVIYANNRISYWTSVPYTGPGTYEITTGLRFIPKDGENVKAIITVNDEMGNRIAMKTVIVTM
jgi:hypothetical protein